jgi:hypothetical protein
MGQLVGRPNISLTDPVGNLELELEPSRHLSPKSFGATTSPETGGPSSPEESPLYVPSSISLMKKPLTVNKEEKKKKKRRRRKKKGWELLCAEYSF